MITTRRLGAGIATVITVGCTLTCLGASHDPPDAHDVTIAASHGETIDEGRFFTNRGVGSLPLPHETNAFMFAVFGDRTGGPAEGVEILAQAVEDVNLIEPDLVMTVGDLVEGYNQTNQWLSQMREFRGIMDRLLCPWFPVAGNHDIFWRGPGRPPNEHEEHYEMHFGPLWYAFKHKNCGFIVLYTDEGNPETGERSIDKPASQQMSPTQLAWLQTALERMSELQHVFVFLHHPRWLKGNYGDDWDNVHRVLALAGNVRAVFAGHIHRARYDGRVDGIEYVTLATVGGSQSSVAPKAGYLHHINLVTVRPTQIAMSMIPVGEVMDVRAITGEVSQVARQLAGVLPQPLGSVSIDQNGHADSIVPVEINNPAGHAIEVTLIPDTEDSRWQFSPDHAHATIPAGTTRTFRFVVSRIGSGIDDSIRLPRIRRRLDLLADGARFPLPERSVPFDVDIDLPAPAVPTADHVLDLDGNDCFIVDNDQFVLPDGPMTLECWFNGRDFTGRRGLVAKTESSEYAFFVSDGTLAFSLHLDGDHEKLIADSVTLEPNRWYHAAGVFDGSEIRLYVNGALVARTATSGSRTRNSLPLIIGADVDGGGNPTSHFTGQIDAVHLSEGVRYTDNHFDPSRRFSSNERTVLLLNMDGRTGPWLYDESASRAHPMASGDPAVVPTDG